MDGVRSGLVCLVDPADERLEELRSAHDPHAPLGVPAHVTCVAPFAPPDLIDTAVLDVLTALASAVDAFTVQFAEVGEFPGVVWLRPHPEEPFRALTRSLVTAFPEYPPYEGAFPDPQPHLTIGMDLGQEGAARLRATVDAEVVPRLPLSAVVDSLSLLVLDEDGRWREEGRFPFHRRPQAGGRGTRPIGIA